VSADYTRLLDPAELFHRGNLGQGMRDAIEEIEGGYQAMIESWHRR
jgi:hypothetical protein